MVEPVTAGRVENAQCPHNWAFNFFDGDCGHDFRVAVLRHVELNTVQSQNMALLGIEGHRELGDRVLHVMRSIAV